MIPRCSSTGCGMSYSRFRTNRCRTPSSLGQRISNFVGVLIRSPAELRVYDSQGRVTGLVNGESKEEILDSTYDEDNKAVIIFDAIDTYRYELVGTNTGNYALDVVVGKDRETQTFTATDIPISPSTRHEYAINWKMLSQGEKGATVRIDADGDGTSEHTIVANKELTQDEYISAISVTPKGKYPTTWGDLKRTVLFQNYPNPFNPDTWIPYILAEKSRVVVGIYDSTGRLIRKLDLSTKPAGVYLSKEKAAYWDGCDNAGESVASGIYFYTLYAGSFRETKKMAIIR